MDDLKALKSELRSMVLAKRDALPPETRAAAAEALARLADALPIEPGTRLSVFHPIRSEIDSRALVERLAARGARLCLPVILEDRTTMVFRAWAPGEPLHPASFGLSVPAETAPLVEPDAMLVPLAVFDRRGYRIGYGKGHYDRAIARIEGAGRRLVKIGLAYALQEVPRVPAEAHDAPLDMVAIEAGLLACGEAAQ